MRSKASRALRLACQRLDVGALGQPGRAWRLPAMAAPPTNRSFACNAGLGRPPPPEVVITYGADRLEDFLAAADELEDRFPGLVVTGVEGRGAPPTAFEVSPPRPARPGGEDEDGAGSVGGPTLWSGLALGRPPAPGEVAALLAAAGVGGSPQNPADGLGCGGIGGHKPCVSLTVSDGHRRGRAAQTRTPHRTKTLAAAPTNTDGGDDDHRPPPRPPQEGASSPYSALAAALTLDDPSHPLVTSGPSPRGGRGLVATRAVSCGAVLISLDPACALVVADATPAPPGSLPSTALSDWSALHAPLPPLLASYILSGPDNWFARAVAWLSWAVRHGPPAWRLYGDVLPPLEELSSLMTFSPEEADVLLSPAPGLVAAVEKERAAIAGLHDRLFSSTTGSLAPLDLAPTFDHTLRCAALVNSRSFADAVTLDDGSTIAISLVVPCVDLANHDGDGATARFGFLDTGDGSFGLTAVKDLSAGEEVTISYTGDDARAAPSKDSSRMLRDYGFVPPGNAGDRLAPLAAGVGEAASLAPGSPGWEAVRARAAATAVSASVAGASPADLAAGRRAAAALASVADAVAAPVGGGGAAGSALVGGGVPRLAAQAAELAAQARSRAAECTALAGGEGRRPGIAPSRAAAAAGWWTERAALAAAVVSLLEA